jgi:glutathione synthase/RimK-type ligase-like ATP-grasp enzyme
LNRLRATSTNASKPYQSRIIKGCGFEIPPTIVTNDPQAVRDFQAAHGRLIYKSISSVRSIVRELGPVELLKLGLVRHLPTQFQAFIPGVNIRVHIVGARVFATRIESAAIDYRYAGRDGEAMMMTAMELPVEISERCVQLSQKLDLPLCGIDLKLTPDGAYYCFEVNPSPAYTYYQERTGQPIAQAIVEWLLPSTRIEIRNRKNRKE